MGCREFARIVASVEGRGLVGRRRFCDKLYSCSKIMARSKSLQY